MFATYSSYRSSAVARTVSAAAVATGILTSVPAYAQTPNASEGSTYPVVVVVKIPTPWYAFKALVVSKMRDTIAEYERIDALTYKVFSFAKETGDFGGIYYWKDRQAAQNWFTPQWFERVKNERGNPAAVRYFEAPVTIDNTTGGTPRNAESKGVATVVEIPTPSGVSKARLIEEFKAAVPTYQKVHGLLRKHFTISDTGAFGGIYIWSDEASAKAWFSSSWHEQVRSKYGYEAKVEWFDTPILLPTRVTAML
jgi:heme-degrading monooxygenase HmoA